MNPNWYHNTKPDSSQGLVIEETTGRSVAVAYDPKDTPLLAAAPKLLEALIDCAAALSPTRNSEEREALAKACSAIAEAKNLR
jgi:hypothetical protein